MLDLRRIHRDQKGSLLYLEPVLERVRAMSFRLAGDGDALVQEVWDLLAKKSPALGLWVALEDEMVVGHILAFIRTWDARWCGWISQIEHDGAYPGRAVRDVTISTLENWVEEWNLVYGKPPHNARVTTLKAVSARMTEAWFRHTGFTPTQWIHERPVRGG